MSNEQPTPSIAGLVRYARVRGTLAIASAAAAGGTTVYKLETGGLSVSPGSRSFLTTCFAAGAAVGSLVNIRMTRRARAAITQLRAPNPSPSSGGMDR